MPALATLDPPTVDDAPRLLTVANPRRVTWTTRPGARADRA